VSFQWYRDGQPLPGETLVDLDVPGDLPEGTYHYHCVLACEDPAGCMTPSEAVEHVVAPLPSPVRGASIQGRVLVAEAQPGVRLDWTDAALDATAYAVYEGTISSLWSSRAYDHAVVLCAVPRDPPGRTDMSVMFDPSTPAAYFLVAPADCRAEGLVGADSFGRTRPVAGSGPACGPAPP
jgi:hypothetical protein